MRGFNVTIALAAIGLAMAASAVAGREFPADAKPADFAVVQFPVVILGKQTLRLAPGAQIRDESNLIVLPTSLSGKYGVLYTLDRSGEVFRVWILTPDEAKQFKAPWYWPW